MDLWPLAFVALAPLIVALRGQSPRRALGLGWAAGFTMTMCGFYWLLEMLRVFSGFGTALCFVFMAILCAYQAGRIALSGWLYGRAEARGWPAGAHVRARVRGERARLPAALPLVLRRHGAQRRALHPDGRPRRALPRGARARGREPRRGRAGRSPGGRGAPRPVESSPPPSQCPPLAAVYGYVRLRSVDAAAAEAPPVKIGIIQGNQPLLGKSRALQVHVARTQELKKEGVDLVVWSEGASGTMNRETPDYGDVRHVITNRLGIPTIVGTLLARRDGKSLPLLQHRPPRRQGRERPRPLRQGVPPRLRRVHPAR